jgi:hypothetical protein
MADVTERGVVTMKSVYERKAFGRVRGTWMDRFMQLEPKDGFRTVVQQAWRRGASTPSEASRPETLAA